MSIYSLLSKIRAKETVNKILKFIKFRSVFRFLNILTIQQQILLSLVFFIILVYFLITALIFFVLGYNFTLACIDPLIVYSPSL